MLLICCPRYELQIDELHLLDYYGGMAILSAKEYFAANLRPHGTVTEAAAETREQGHRPQQQQEQEKQQGGEVEEEGLEAAVSVARGISRSLRIL